MDAADAKFLPNLVVPRLSAMRRVPIALVRDKGFKLQTLEPP